MSTTLLDEICNNLTNGGGNKNIRCFRYDEVFDDLWSDGFSKSPMIGGAKWNWYDSRVITILYGSKAPHRRLTPELKNLNLSGRVSALAWAAAWRLTHPLAKGRVLIIDEPQDENSPAKQELAAICEAHDGASQLARLGVHWVRDFVASKDVCVELIRRGGEEIRQTALSVLRNTLWHGLSGDKDDRHSLSNLVGAQILRAALGIVEKPHTKAGEVSYETALGRLMRAAGLIPLDDASWNKTFSLPSSFKKVILVDDMAEQWASVLKKALKSRVDCLPLRNADGSIKRSVLLDLVSNRGRPIVRQKSDDAGFQNAILFLDLRLFANDKPENEREFFRDLLDLADQLRLKNTKRLKLPWPGFAANELRKIEQFLSGSGRKRDDKAYHLALTLLPRLLALAEPALPIIIFSSTRQRTVVEALRDYGNIVLDLQKPMFFGGGDLSDTVEDARQSFMRAIKRAVKVGR